MAYARFGRDSDVYVFLSTRGGIECCRCALIGDASSFVALTTAEILEHLEQHRTRGHRVPDDCIAALDADAEENDAQIAANDAKSRR
ncbi:MAG: hypothetical protein L0Y66_04325 [Myxococcaceae bacterium]|nr:hypothetical protein [Myxococcaceae bacterium]MCI0672318.1 hypothetical protein [Myxococcaceae bacterium]